MGRERACSRKFCKQENTVNGASLPLLVIPRPPALPASQSALWGSQASAHSPLVHVTLPSVRSEPRLHHSADSAVNSSLLRSQPLTGSSDFHTGPLIKALTLGTRIGCRTCLVICEPDFNFGSSLAGSFGQCTTCTTVQASPVISCCVSLICALPTAYHSA